MKKIISLFLAAIIFAACGSKSNFTISGSISGGEGKTIYLNKLLTNSQIALDSVKLDSQGKFKIDGHTSFPTFYLLKISDTNFATLLVDSAENLSITGSYPNFAFDYTIDGSSNSKLVKNLNSKFRAVSSRMDSIKNIYNKNQNNPAQNEYLAKLDSQYTQTATNYTNYANTFVKENAFSPSAIYALYQKWSDGSFVINDLQIMKTAASALNAMYPKNDQVITLYKNTLDIMKTAKNNQTIQLLKSNAVNSPNIQLSDPNGLEQSLWSLHGKYVLLHFWSATDRTSRIQNEALREAYSKYKSRGFEIFMVSIDTNKDLWTKAIAEDNLTCINVGDMKGSNQALINYNIQSVPSNYLLDKEGVFLAKNLQGTDLNNALAKFVK